MALITYIDANDPNGQRIMNAVDQIRTGLGTLQEFDGLRAESISAGQATMASNFGLIDNAQAQALSDRWSALLAAYGDTGNAEFAKLRDLINATAYQ